MEFNFQKKYSFEKRQSEARRIMDKYPERVPIIIEKYTGCTNVPEIDKTKYLVPRDLNVGQLEYVIRKRIKLPSEQAIFIFLEDNTLPTISNLLSEIYHEHANEDGFLYISYSGEATFG